jgi:serine/threonine protein kinase
MATSSETHCVQYDSDGYYFTSFIHTTKIFRKISRCLTEIEICNILKKHPHPNCVTIYAINGFCIDMEFLDTSYAIENKYDILNDVKNAIKHLNSFGIIYIDLKLDNIGRGNGGYKLFDFDMSGICALSKWSRAPHPGYVYKDFYKHSKTTNLFDLDEFALLKFEKTLF